MGSRCAAMAKKTIINLECKRCKREFDFNAGNIRFSEKDRSPIFENQIICTHCGPLTQEDVFLTFLGQSQLTDIYLHG